ncbi:MAG: AAA family ATPase [Flavonifractor plautii]
MEHSRREKEEAIRGQDFEKAAMLRDAEEDFRKELEQQKTAWRSGQQHRRGDRRGRGRRGVQMDRGPRRHRSPRRRRQRLLGLEEALHQPGGGPGGGGDGAVARAIRRGRVGLKEPKRPTGCFLFLGPTGVGKTELCKALAATLFGSEEALLRFDMSEYMEKHTVSRLSGLAAGLCGLRRGRASSPKRCGASPIAWCSSTRSKRPTPTSGASCSRSWRTGW